MKDITIKTIGLTLVSCCLVIMFYLTIISLNLSSSNIRTEHVITINSDNETKEIVKYMSQIKEHQVKQDQLFCENRLLNITNYYEQELYGLEHYFQVYCWDGEGYKAECNN